MTDERNLLTREELNLIDDFLVTSEPRVWGRNGFGGEFERAKSLEDVDEIAEEYRRNGMINEKIHIPRLRKLLDTIEQMGLDKYIDMLAEERRQEIIDEQKKYDDTPYEYFASIEFDYGKTSTGVWVYHRKPKYVTVRVWKRKPGYDDSRVHLKTFERIVSYEDRLQLAKVLKGKRSFQKYNIKKICIRNRWDTFPMAQFKKDYEFTEFSG